MADHLVRDIERFVAAHADELNDHDQFIMGHAAGIVARIHDANSRDIKRDNESRNANNATQQRIPRNGQSEF